MEKLVHIVPVNGGVALIMPMRPRRVSDPASMTQKSLVGVVEMRIEKFHLTVRKQRAVGRRSVVRKCLLQKVKMGIWRACIYTGWLIR